MFTFQKKPPPGGRESKHAESNTSTGSAATSAPRSLELPRAQGAIPLPTRKKQITIDSSYTSVGNLRRIQTRLTRDVPDEWEFDLDEKGASLTARLRIGDARLELVVACEQVAANRFDLRVRQTADLQLPPALVGRGNYEGLVERYASAFDGDDVVGVHASIAFWARAAGVYRHLARPRVAPPVSAPPGVPFAEAVPREVALSETKFQGSPSELWTELCRRYPLLRNVVKSDPAARLQAMITEEPSLSLRGIAQRLIATETSLQFDAVSARAALGEEKKAVVPAVSVDTRNSRVTVGAKRYKYTLKAVTSGAKMIVEIPFRDLLSPRFDRDELARRIAAATSIVTAPNVLFVNAATMEPRAREAPPEARRAAQRERVEIARNTVRRFLRARGIRPAFALPPVEFIDRAEVWRARARALDKQSARDMLEIMEGLTPPHMHRDPGEAKSIGLEEIEYKILINGGYHTIGAIVHEMFHALAHDAVEEFTSGTKADMAEALTEYLTVLASGVVARRTKLGSDAYGPLLGRIKAGIKAGEFTEGDVLAAYFRGDGAALKKINASFFKKEKKK